jgi:bifunctional ADP-heptose synthase (sugar kinase/adenylyltransferase)
VTLAVAAGASFYEAARLANYAGGIVVMKRGTATVTADELRQAVRADAAAHAAVGADLPASAEATAGRRSAPAAREGWQVGPRRGPNDVGPRRRPRG